MHDACRASPYIDFRFAALLYLYTPSSASFSYAAVP